MAKLSPQGPFRAFDADGLPLAGGKLYTYAAGTTTPKATYTTEAAGTPNTNPVILDADGYANVWLGDGSYKLVLKTSADVTLWTIDDVVGDASSGFAAAVINQATNLNISDAYAGYFINATAGITLSLLSASMAGDGFYFTAKASGGAIVLDPDGSETIDGASTKTIPVGYSALVVTNGSVWYTAFMYVQTSIFSGSVTINGTSTESAYIDMYEDTDNGTNKVKFQAPQTLASDVVVTLPSATGTLATLAGTEALTNKSVNGVTLTTGGATTSILSAAGTYVTTGITSFQSTDQTITSAGSLTLAHGLAGVPKIVSLYLICQTTDAGYAANDIVCVAVQGGSDGGSGSQNTGIAAWVDATNVNIRYGSSTSVVIINNKTTGALAAITNANWKLRVMAFY